MTRQKRLSPEQRRALQCLADGDGSGEFWAQHDGTDRLAWYRSERTLDSLMRRGWIDDAWQLTPRGRETLDTADNLSLAANGIA